MLLKNINKKILILFITLNIMNSISWLNLVNMIGMYGKIILPLLSIVYFSINSRGRIIKMKNTLIFSTFFISIIFFSIIFFLKNTLGFFDASFRSIMFFIYIIFIYSLLKNFLLVNTYDFKINIKDSILCEILEILRNTLIINTLIWTIIAIILNQNLYDIDPTGGRSGFSAFCGDRMVFGLIMATIYLSSFIIITNKKNIKLNLIIIGISILFILYSDSRTALSIVIIPTFFYLIKQKIKYVDFLILLISLILIVYMWNNFDDSITNEYSSGRIFVWSLFFKEFFPNNFIYGYGLFNFNDFILNKYMNLSYYFQRVDFLYFHSSYIEIWASGGILGIFSYILILYKTYINAKNSIKALLLGIIIGSFFESFIILPVFSISLLFWIIVIYENINFNEKRTS